MVSAMSIFPAHAPAQASSPAALQGVVTSHQEGRMEGVVVSARRGGAQAVIGKIARPRACFEGV